MVINVTIYRLQKNNNFPSSLAIFGSRHLEDKARETGLVNIYISQQPLLCLTLEDSKIAQTDKRKGNKYYINDDLVLKTPSFSTITQYQPILSLNLHLLLYFSKQTIRTKKVFCISPDVYSLFRENRTKKLFVHVLYAEQLICKLSTTTVFWFVLLRSQTTVSNLNGCLELDKRKVHFYLAWELKTMQVLAFPLFSNYSVRMIQYHHGCISEFVAGVKFHPQVQI